MRRHGLSTEFSLTRSRALGYAWQMRRLSPVLAAGLLLTLLGAPPALAEEMVLVGAHLLKLVDDTTPPIYPGKRKFNWRVRSGGHPIENQVVIPDGGTDGDPTLHGATFTLYNAAGSGEVWSVPLPAEQWVRTGNSDNGYRYIYVSTGPIHKIWLKENKLTFKGGKSLWGYSLDEPSQGALAVRLTLGTGITWCTVAQPHATGTPPSSEKFDRVDLFRARRYGDPPASCPDVPTP